MAKTVKLNATASMALQHADSSSRVVTLTRERENLATRLADIDKTIEDAKLAQDSAIRTILKDLGEPVKDSDQVSFKAETRIEKVEVEETSRISETVTRADGTRAVLPPREVTKIVQKDMEKLTGAFLVTYGPE